MLAVSDYTITQSNQSKVILVMIIYYRYEFHSPINKWFFIAPPFNTTYTLN